MLPPRPWEPVGRYYLKEWLETTVEYLAVGLQNIFWGDEMIRSHNPAQLIRWGSLRYNRMTVLRNNISVMQQKIYERDIPYEEHPSFC